MSGLIFKGDVIQSTGEYLPAPYINKIIVSQDYDEANSKFCEYSVEMYVFADDYNYVDVLKDGNIETSQEAYRQYLNNFNYYIMSVSGLGEQTYTDMTEGRINPLHFYKDFIDNKDTNLSYVNGDVRMYRFNALDNNTIQEIYDDDDNKITVYSTTIESTQINTSLPTNTIAPFDQNVEYVFAFCSLFNYDNDSELLEADNFNLQLLNLQTSDVSYENVYSSGDRNELENIERIKFYDGEDFLYDKTPLASVEQQIYKIFNLTHDDIKDSINSLLEEYSTQYNSEFGFENLQNEMNKIYSTLYEYGDKYNIVQKLEEIRISFSDKNPSTAVGKFYKRYAKRVYEINKGVKQGEILYKKLVYNTKILDQRTLIVPDPTEPSAIETDNYIYSSPNNFTNLRIDDDKSIIAGYFFFDYEKALRTKSKISEHIDINKLEMLGLNIPYESFKISEIMVSRDDETIMTIKSSETKAYPVMEKIEYNLDERGEFGLFYVSSIEDDDYNEEIKNSLFYGSDQTSAKDNAALGFVTSLINRSYAYSPSNAFEIENYRLMLLEILDYRTRDGSIIYNIEMKIQDNTLQEFINMLEIFEQYYQQYNAYVFLTQEFCVYNENTQKFNKYFTENLIQNFGSSSDSLWYTAPVIYSMFLDILYNLYDGDKDAIEDAAKSIVNNINPYTGTPNSIILFKDKMSEIYNTLQNMKNDIIGFRRDETIPVETEIKGFALINDSQDKIYSASSSSDIEVSYPVKTIDIDIGSTSVRYSTNSGSSYWSIDNGISLYNNQNRDFSDGLADELKQYEIFSGIEIREITTVYWSPEKGESSQELTPITYLDQRPDQHAYYEENEKLIYDFNLLEEPEFKIFAKGYYQIEYR